MNNHSDLFEKNIPKNYIGIVGCFQKGLFSEEILSFSDKIVSISHYHLDAWVALSKIIGYYEISNGVL